jgi:hypothetical protein
MSFKTATNEPPELDPKADPQIWKNQTCLVTSGPMPIYQAGIIHSLSRNDQPPPPSPSRLLQFRPQSTKFRLSECVLAMQSIHAIGHVLKLIERTWGKKPGRYEAE